MLHVAASSVCRTVSIDLETAQFISGLVIAFEIVECAFGMNIALHMSRGEHPAVG